MTTSPDDLKTKKDPIPWPFTKSELTAGLRRRTGDPSLQIKELNERRVPQLTSSAGIIRGMRVDCSGVTGKYKYNFVVKEPRGSTRTGTAGAGLREVSLYRSLTPHLPLRVPELLASHPMGSWMVMDMLPPGRKSNEWKSEDYMLAIDQLVSLHDRFWNLSDHLIMYTWLARPLTSDYKIHIRAAEQGLQNLRDSYITRYLTDTNFMDTLDSMVDGAEQICTTLSKAPKTLLHGDYWPGNIRRHEDGSYTVYDWQEAAIGYCLIDLIDFITSSCWWCVPLPMSPQDMVKRYREVLKDTSGYSWKKGDWIQSLDYSSLWVFLFKWIGLLNRLPENVFAKRIDLLEEVWLQPIRKAVERQL